MKPQIVALSNEGVHNADLPKSTARIIEGASWKKQRVSEQQRNWYLRNAEHKRKYAREYYKKNREKRIQKAKEYRAKRPEITLASRLRCSYGMSVDAYEAMLLAQAMKCAICRIAFDGKSKLTTPHVDHCHSSGVVRGILCSKCNASLGHLEKAGFLDGAMKYLGKE